MMGMDSHRASLVIMDLQAELEAYYRVAANAATAGTKQYALERIAALKAKIAHIQGNA